jgi:tetratricopeptide (TPR) repeat protein
LQFSYHEYELVLDEEVGLRILDWSDFMWGEKFTDSIGNTLVAASPRPQAVRKMIKYKNIRDQEVFQLTELLKAARDSDIKRYAEIINAMEPRLLQERSVVLLSVQMSKNWGNRRMLRTALVQMAQYFPDDPLYSLALLDYYVPSRMYAEAVAGLQRTYAKFGFEDAAMEARLSALTLEMDHDADALAHAERAVELEPGLELAWWSALRARAAMANYGSAVEALQQLEQEHGHTLGAAELERDKTFAALLASEEFTSWAATRQ